MASDRSVFVQRLTPRSVDEPACEQTHLRGAASCAAGPASFSFPPVVSRSSRVGIWSAEIWNELLDELESSALETSVRESPWERDCRRRSLFFSYWWHSFSFTSIFLIRQVPGGPDPAPWWFGDRVHLESLGWSSGGLWVQAVRSERSLRLSPKVIFSLVIARVLPVLCTECAYVTALSILTDTLGLANIHHHYMARMNMESRKGGREKRKRSREHHAKWKPINFVPCQFL